LVGQQVLSLIAGCVVSMMSTSNRPLSSALLFLFVCWAKVLMMV